LGGSGGSDADTVTSGWAACAGSGADDPFRIPLSGVEFAGAAAGRGGQVMKRVARSGGRTLRARLWRQEPRVRPILCFQWFAPRFLESRDAARKSACATGKSWQAETAAPQDTNTKHAGLAAPVWWVLIAANAQSKVTVNFARESIRAARVSKRFFGSAVKRPRRRGWRWTRRRP
jgi:hypothetical protein